MQGFVRLFALLLVPLAAFGASISARAGDASLFYAPPEQAAHAIAAAKAFPPADPPQERICFNSAETRERIATHKLTEPFQALQTGNLQGDALRAKLCRWKKDEFVYEISVLRHDGRIVHVYMNAQSGRTVDR